MYAQYWGLQDTPFANLVHTILDRSGVHMEEFADSTGPIAEV